MAASPLARRAAALGLLGAALLIAGGTVTTLLRTYMEGQWEIASKRAQLDNMRELADARNAFGRLAPRKGSAGLILPADADGGAALETAVKRAAEGQQVIVDGIEALPPDPVTRSAAVHLRATQAGLYNFLRNVEDQVPYLLVPRLEVTPSRSADPEHGKPFVVSADLRLAVLVAPAPAPRRPPAPADAAAP